MIVVEGKCRSGDVLVDGENEKTACPTPTVLEGKCLACRSCATVEKTLPLYFRVFSADGNFLHRGR